MAQKEKLLDKLNRYERLENKNYRIRIKEFYPNDRSGQEYTEVNRKTLIYLLYRRRVDFRKAKQDERNVAVFGFNSETIGKLDGKFIESAEDTVCKKETYKAVSDAMGKISVKVKNRIILHEICGIDESRIAAAEGVSQPAVSASIQAGLETVKAILCKSDKFNE